MRTSSILIGALLVGFACGTAAATHNGSVGPGHGIVLPSPDENPCDGAATLQLNFDASAENGYCWDLYGGRVPPYYGAFAECYNWTGHVCGIELWLTGLGYVCDPCDLYVWEDAGGVPGNILGMTPGVDPCPIATWPQITVRDLGVGCVDVNGPFWVGYWEWAVSAPCGYFIAADTNGFGSCPFTNIAPGIGYPTGWVHVTEVWGPTSAVGIGAWCGEGPCGPVPTRETTWGAVKRLYTE
jgi:hypothetical protein